MSHKLIYSFLALGSLTIATACSSTESVDESIGDGVAVKFTARTDDSRANITTNTSIKNTPFVVYGDMVPTASASTATPTVIFPGTPVTFSTADNAWQYDTPQYWFPNHTHSFVALHPASAVTDAQYLNNTLSFSYTLPAYSEENPTAYRSTPDILVATHRRNYTPGDTPTGAVAFNFAHVLSRINFTAEVKTGELNTIVVDNFTIHNVHTSATYTITPAPILGSNSQADDYVDGTWTDHNTIPDVGNQLLRFPTVTSVNIEPANSRQFFRVDNNPLFVIPQKIPENIEVLISYHAVDNQGNTVGTPVIDLPAHLHQYTLQHGGEWLPGKSYNYTFAIGVDTDITFKTPTVEDWTESLGGNYIIPD